MNRTSLISSLELLAKINLFRDVAGLALQILKENINNHVNVDINDSFLCVEKIYDIYRFRLLRSKEVGNYFVGLEETVQSLATMSGKIKIGGAAVSCFSFVFFIDDHDKIQGLVIFDKSKRKEKYPLD
jgi:hypothetical protein